MPRFTSLKELQTHLAGYLKGLLESHTSLMAGAVLGGIDLDLKLTLDEAGKAEVSFKQDLADQVKERRKTMCDVLNLDVDDQEIWRNHGMWGYCQRRKLRRKKKAEQERELFEKPKETIKEKIEVKI